MPFPWSSLFFVFLLVRHMCQLLFLPPYTPGRWSQGCFMTVIITTPGSCIGTSAPIGCRRAHLCCQIKVSEWRSVGEQRSSVCRISTYKLPPERSVHALPHGHLFNHSRPLWMLSSPSARTFFDSRGYQCKSAQSHTINHFGVLNKWLALTNACGQHTLGAESQHLVHKWHSIKVVFNKKQARSNAGPLPMRMYSKALRC